MEAKTINSATPLPENDTRAEDRPSVEVRPMRRRFTSAYKRRILAEAAACKQGEVGLLLRREGLYSSILATWRTQLKSGGEAALAGRCRGPKPVGQKGAAAEKARMARQIASLEKRLQQAELIIDVQKKLSQMLGLPGHDELI